ncbi:MAG TPA: Xaa-Pro peptidase family protein [Candidatus Polarisedimenticolaceae bacterium]|nr:Xaa-Pro peptidase family protein [Candidatus Polarisedimenticolaceae bacterium]
MLYNQERLLALMDKFDLAGVVAATPENIYYLSGHASWSQNGYRYGGSQVYVVYPRDPKQSPALLIPGGDVGYASLDEVWLQEKYIYGRPRHAQIADPSKLAAVEQRTVKLAGSDTKGPTAEKALTQLIRDKGMDQGRIGMDHFAIPLTIWEKIKAGLPQATMLPASSFFRYVRMIKTPAEIQRLRESAELNERAINRMLSAAKPGAKESELAGIYKSEIARAGGQVYWMHMAVSRGGNFPAIKDNVLQKGDVFRVDMGCSINGYHADVCKSGCVGAEPTTEHRKRYDAIQAGVLKSVEALKPGVCPQELYETMIEGVRANGLPNYSNFFLGHTIGLEAREFPFLIGPAEEVDDPFLPNTTNIPMEPGMTVNLEASNHEAGWGTVQVEYTCAVTDTGHQHLITPDQRLLSLPLE